MKQNEERAKIEKVATVMTGHSSIDINFSIIQNALNEIIEVLNEK